MSAKKNPDQGVVNTQSSSEIDPAAVALPAGNLRSLLKFHQDIGLNFYPATPELRQFLKKKEQVPPPPRTFAKKRQQEPPPVSREAGVQAEETLRIIQREIRECSLCSLSAECRGVVIGTGTTQPLLMVVGDWSLQEGNFSLDVLFGRAEDEMLWNMMKAIGLTRENVYVSNCIKCCPQPGHNPDTDNAQSCFCYLTREIEAIRPKVICTMGDLVSRLLLDNTGPLVRLRGRFHQCRCSGKIPAPVMPTFHPRFLLRHPELKKAAWQDLQMIQRRMHSG